MYISADTGIYFETGCNTIANRKVAVLKNDGTFTTTGNITAPTFIGALSGNASTSSKATQLANDRTISLTGDATASGSFNGTANLALSTTLANSGVTAGSYGPSANASPAHGKTFSVPYITVDAKGRVTAASTKTITLPTDNNTTYSKATSSTLGLVKIGYTESGKNYPVELDSDGKMFVNVPWTDNNTVYTHPSYTARTGKPTANQTPAFGGTATVSQITSDATGHVTGATDRTITIPSTLSNGTGTAGLIKTSSTVTSNSGYTACPVISGVPYYKDTNTTYSNMTAATADAAGKAGLVPAPAAGKQTSFLRGDGAWAIPTNTDTKVKITANAPTAYTSYYPTLHTSTSGTVEVTANADTKFSIFTGTATDEGNSRLILGNATAKGTDKNSTGKIILYSNSTNSHTITPATTTSGITHTLPATSGTVLNTGTTSFTQSLTSGTKVGSIKINGTSTDLYAPTNTDTKNTAGSTDSSSKLFLIGATSQAANPQTYSHDTAYVGTDGCLYSGSKKVSVEGHTHDYLPASNAYFEFNGTTSSSGHGGYLDFHFNGSTADYTSRIIESASGTLTVSNNLVVGAGTNYTTNKVRNSVFTTTDPGANASTSHANGSIICVYE